MRCFYFSLNSYLRFVFEFCHSSLLDTFFWLLLYGLLIYLRRIHRSSLLLILLLTCKSWLRITPSLGWDLSRKRHWSSGRNWRFRESCWNSCRHRSVWRMLISSSLLWCGISISWSWCLVSIGLRLCCSLISWIRVLCLWRCVSWSRSRSRRLCWSSYWRRRSKSSRFKWRICIKKLLNVVVKSK